MIGVVLRVVLFGRRSHGPECRGYYFYYLLLLLHITSLFVYKTILNPKMSKKFSTLTRWIIFLNQTNKAKLFPLRIKNY